MNMQPRLILTDMYIRQCTPSDVVSYKCVQIELWKEVGMALHQYEHGYGISHYPTGISILKKLKDRSQAIVYMMELHAVLSDWRGTYDQMVAIASTMPIVERVISLQHKIDNTKE